MPTPRIASLMRVPLRQCHPWAFRPKVDGRWSLISKSSDDARLYSSLSHDIESHDVKCGSSGFITVDIYNSHALTISSRPLIIYLPPAGTHLRSTHPAIPSFLYAHPLAAINYRWNHIPTLINPTSLSNRPPSPFTTITNSHPFPTPLHDTLHAYMWLTNQYLPSFNLPTSELLQAPSEVLKQTQDPYPTPPTSHRSRSRSPYVAENPRSKISPRSIILYGSHLGGTLAASLALTECKASKKVSVNIAGLVVRDGVFDWTHVAASRDPSLPSGPSSPPSPLSHSSDSHEEQSNLATELVKPWSLHTLHTLKTHLFSSPASAFDLFASPLLFFRTPGLAVPKLPYFPGCEPPATAPPSVDLSALSLSDAEYAALTSSEFDTLPASEQPSSDKKEGEEEAKPEDGPETARSSHLRFPPRDSGLKIPRSLFLVSNTASSRRQSQEDGDGGQELRTQAEKMARLMRRSIVLHEFKDRVMWDEDLDPHAASEERVQLVELQGKRKVGEGEEDNVVGEWLEGTDY